MTTASLIETDCQILLERAFLNKRICAFGEDGCGQHGQHTQAFWFNVRNVQVDLACDDDDLPTILQGTVSIYLDGYDSQIHGYIATDKNFDICCRELLRQASIDEDCLKWPPTLDEQGITKVVLDIDLDKLLDWV